MCDDYPKGVMFKGRFYVLGGGGYTSMHRKHFKEMQSQKSAGH